MPSFVSHLTSHCGQLTFYFLVFWEECNSTSYFHLEYVCPPFQFYRYHLRVDFNHLLLRLLLSSSSAQYPCTWPWAPNPQLCESGSQEWKGGRVGIREGGSSCHWLESCAVSEVPSSLLTWEEGWRSTWVTLGCHRCDQTEQVEGDTSPVSNL